MLFCATAATPQSFPTAGASAQEAPIVWPSGPRWRPGLLTATTNNFVCLDRRISLQFTYEASLIGAGWRMVVRRLVIDGRNARRDTISGMNAVLAGFPSPPEVSPQCIGRRIRFNFAQIERTRVSRSEYFEIDPP